MAAANGTRIRIDGKDNLFDFTYIDDVIQGVLSYICHLNKSDESLPPIHFTMGQATSLGEAAFFAQQAVEHPIEIVEAPPRDYDVARFYGDPSRAETLLNWKPCVDVQEGMRRLIHQYQVVSQIGQLEYEHL